MAPVKQRLNSLHLSKKYGIKTYVVASLLLFLASISVSIYYWYSMRQNVRTEFTQVAEREISTSEQAIGTRLQIYGDIMIGGIGLFRSSAQVTREEWELFISSYNVTTRYPGVQGFGYADYVSQTELPIHSEAMRQSGISDYSVSPAGDREIYVPVMYISPFSETRRAIIGFDMFSDIARQDAIVTARDTGRPATTGTVRLVQNKEGEVTNQEPGFIIFVPLYEPGLPVTNTEERRKAIKGFVYAPFRINELLKGIFGDDGSSEVGLEVYDGDQKNEDNRMYQSANYDELSKKPGVYRSEKKIRFAQREWIMQYAVAPHILSESERNSPWATLSRGLLTSVVVTLLVYYLLTNRARKLMRAKQEEVQTAKDDLLSLASHQLRTPATVVKQYVGMLLQGYGGKLTAQQKNMLTNAYISNERQLNIINQILYVARLDAGQIKLQKDRFDLTQLVKDVTREHEATVREHEQKLIRHLPRKHVHVEGDRQYLHMALDNLMSNASKYTPDKGRITVTMEALEDEVAISVRDTGVGINKNDIETIFEKFSRVDNELSTQASGSGIGLYLVKQIVELHGGTITAEPAVPKGTIFTLSIPLQKTVKRRGVSSNAIN